MNVLYSQNGIINFNHYVEYLNENKFLNEVNLLEFVSKEIVYGILIFENRFEIFKFIIIFSISLIIIFLACVLFLIFA